MTWLLLLLALAGWLAYAGECQRSRQQQHQLEFYKYLVDYWKQKAQAKTGVFTVKQPDPCGAPESTGDCTSGGCGSHDCQC